MTHLDPHIFRAYDLRGEAGTQITPEGFKIIAREFGEILKEKYEKESPAVAVGRDSRTHSPDLHQAVIEGLMEAGCSVKDVGEVPSPVLYFAHCHFELDGSIQITASHNRKEDNGMKLQTRGAHSFCGDAIQELYKRITTSDPGPGPNTAQGLDEEVDAITPYIEKVTSMFSEIETRNSSLKVVIDTGNGVAGPVYTRVLKELGCEVTELYTEPDGTFPNHPADPSKWETLQDLQTKVLEVGADIGFGFDGDGDRLGLVDEKGDVRTADEILLLLAKDHLTRKVGSHVVFTVSCSGALETEIPTWGGTPVMTIVGHAFVEDAMAECGSILGGEQSGHFFCFENYFHYDDALVAALWLLKILAASDKTISELCSEFPEVHQAPEMRPHCPDDRKVAVVESVTEHFHADYPVNDSDGVRIDFGEGAWAGIRKANTSPCLSICIEARSPEKLEEVKEIVLGHMKGYPEVDI